MSRKKTVGRIMSFIFFACLIMGFYWFLFEKDKNVKISASQEVFSKNVQYRFKIWNTHNQPVSPVHFYVYAPVKQTGIQLCDHLEASYPYELVTDPFGNQMLKFTFETFAPFASKIVSLRASLNISKTLAPTIESDPKQFISAASANDPRLAEIRQTADRLRSEKSYITAKNIYLWVADNIADTGYSPQAKDTIHAFSSRKGDCTEFANLFVELANAAGIPARRVSGYLSHENSVLKASDYHDWAEFYEKGTWRIADAQQRNFDTRYSDYVATKIHSFLHPTGPIGSFNLFHIEGSGLKAKMDS